METTQELDFIKEEFYKFLVEQGALFTFLKYKSIEQAMAEYNNEIPRLYYLIVAIPERIKGWQATNEGFDYWCNLNQLWKSRYNRIKPQQ